MRAASLRTERRLTTAGCATAYGGLLGRGNRREARLQSPHRHAETGLDPPDLVGGGHAMSAEDSTLSRLVPLTLAGRVDRACDAFEAAWRAGQRPRIEDLLQTREPDAH